MSEDRSTIDSGRATGNPLPLMRIVGFSGRRMPVGTMAWAVLGTSGMDMNDLGLLCLGLFEPVGHGLSQKTVEIARPFGYPITNARSSRGSWRYANRGDY